MLCAPSPPASLERACQGTSQALSSWNSAPVGLSGCPSPDLTVLGICWRFRGLGVLHPRQSCPAPGASVQIRVGVWQDTPRAGQARCNAVISQSWWPLACPHTSLHRDSRLLLHTGECARKSVGILLVLPGAGDSSSSSLLLLLLLSPASSHGGSQWCLSPWEQGHCPSISSCAPKRCWEGLQGRPGASPKALASLLCK